MTVVVLVLVDLLRQLVLLLLQRSPVGFGEMAVVHRLHIPLFLVQLRFLFLQAGSLIGSQRTVADTISNAVLLFFFTFLTLPASLGPSLNRCSGCRRSSRSACARRGARSLPAGG